MSLVVLIDNVVHLSNTKVIRGEKLDNGNWIPIENETVPPDVILRAGSVVEKSPAQAKIGIRNKRYAEMGTPLHTNLESVFSMPVPFMGKDNQSSLADVLRAYRINTLEQVAENAEGRVPFSDGKQKGGTPIRVKEILLTHGSKDTEQVDEWMATAKEIVAKDNG
jgi:hypothetical protein